MKIIRKTSLEKFLAIIFLVLILLVGVFLLDFFESEHQAQAGYPWNQPLQVVNGNCIVNLGTSWWFNTAVKSGTQSLFLADNDEGAILEGPVWWLNHGNGDPLIHGAQEITIKARNAQQDEWGVWVCLPVCPPECVSGYWDTCYDEWRSPYPCYIPTCTCSLYNGEISVTLWASGTRNSPDEATLTGAANGFPYGANIDVTTGSSVDLTNPTQPIFNWSSWSSGQEAWQVQVWNSSWTSLVWESGIRGGGNQFAQVEIALSPGTYNWRVAACGDTKNKTVAGPQPWTTSANQLCAWTPWANADSSFSISACPAGPPSYPADRWDRVWCDQTLSGKIADVPDEGNLQFDNDWGSGPVAGISNDNIGFRSGRTINLPVNGNYTFTVGSDDGVRVWIDGLLVLDKWFDRGYTTDTFTRNLTAGNHQFRIDYYENGGSARVSFGFPSAGVPTLIAPPNNTWINYNPTYQARVSSPNGNVQAYFEFSAGGPANGWGNMVVSGNISEYTPTTPDGSYQWRAYARDVLSQTSGWTGFWTVKKDTVAPVVSIDQPNGGILTPSFTVYLSESDALSGINQGDVDVRINGGAWSDSGLPNNGSTTDDFIYNGATGNTYEFRYRAMDNAGNWSDYAYDGAGSVYINTSPSVSPGIPAGQPGGPQPGVSQLNYCFVSWPAATFAWTFSDPDPGDTQFAYQLQVDNSGSDCPSPEIDTGKVSPSSSNSYATLPGDLAWNTTYYWCIRVWDSYNAESSWVSGPPFNTPTHGYPRPDFFVSPQNPAIGELVFFIDDSKCYSSPGNTEYDCSGGASISYFWEFGDGQISTKKGNATTTYTTIGPKTAKLTITDNSLYPAASCETTRPVNVTLPLPYWREIPPF